MRGSRGRTTLKRVLLSLAMGTLMAGCDGDGRAGSVSLPSGGFYGQSVFYSCSDGWGFRAVIDSAARHAVVQLGEDSYTLKRAGSSRAGEVYSDGTMRLTIAADGPAHLIVRPGPEMTSCEPMTASGN